MCIHSLFWKCVYIHTVLNHGHIFLPVRLFVYSDDADHIQPSEIQEFKSNGVG